MNSASGSTESASNSGSPVLVVGANWVGDVVMSLPAVQAWRRANPSTRLVVLARRGLADLWRLHAAPDEILLYGQAWAAVRGAAREIRARGIATAYVLPNSFRSALPPFLAGVRERVGLPGSWRRALLTRRARLPEGGSFRHQAWEAMSILAPDALDAALEEPELRIPEDASATVGALVRELPRPLLGIMPGAARGPAKRWPEGRFAEVAREWVRARGGGVVLLGGAGDEAACARVMAGLGPVARNLAGRTAMAAWAAVLAECDSVVCNDSGGMHLAAAVGAPVVAIFGITDPDRTRPVGGTVRILQAPGERSRDIARDSAEAEKRLAEVSAGAVYGAALELCRRA